MPTEQLTLVGGVVSLFPLDAPTGRVIVSIVSGTAAEVYATADGSLPIIPGTGAENSGNMQMISSVLGGQVVLQPPLFGDHMAIATIRLLSAGTPTVLVEW
jgi:hypothetical protein